MDKFHNETLFKLNTSINESETEADSSHTTYKDSDVPRS